MAKIHHNPPDDWDNSDSYDFSDVSDEYYVMILSSKNEWTSDIENDTGITPASTVRTILFTPSFGLMIL